MKNKILIAVLSALVIILAAISVFLFTHKPIIAGVISTSAHSVIKESLPVSEYASLTYRYTSVITHSDSREVVGVKIPLTEKKYIYTYDGIIKLGIDGKAISVKQDGDTIYIMLPPIKVLSHTVDENSIEVYDQTQNIFNQIQVGEAFKINAEQKKIMEEKIKKNGAYDDAKAAAEQQLKTFIEALPGIKNAYKIVIEWQ